MKDKRLKGRSMNPFAMLCFGLAVGAAVRLLAISDLPSLMTGIVLILASLIFRCGAELKAQNHAEITGADQ